MSKKLLNHFSQKHESFKEILCSLFKINMKSNFLESYILSFFLNEKDVFSSSIGISYRYMVIS